MADYIQKSCAIHQTLTPPNWKYLLFDLRFTFYHQHRWPTPSPGGTEPLPFGNKPSLESTLPLPTAIITMEEIEHIELTENMEDMRSTIRELLL